VPFEREPEPVRPAGGDKPAASEPSSDPANVTSPHVMPGAPSADPAAPESPNVDPAAPSIDPQNPPPGTEPGAQRSQPFGVPTNQ
jgi:hypothetical protein